MLSSFGMDILRGYAFTNPNGLVLDVFQFTDEEQFLELNAAARGRVLDVLQDVVAGRTDVAARLRGREQGILRRRAPVRIQPVVHGDNECVEPLHHPRDRRRQRARACCTASAGPSRSTAATSTSC